MQKIVPPQMFEDITIIIVTIITIIIIIVTMIIVIVGYNLIVRFTIAFGTNIEENTAINYMLVRLLPH